VTPLFGDIKACSAAASNLYVTSTALRVDQSIVLLVNSLIEVFVRSFSTNMDVGTCRDIVQHPMCAPETTEGLVREDLSNFKGRLLPREDSAVFERVLEIAGKTRGSVKIYDLSKVADNLRALRRGIFKTPVVMIDGERCDGFENISRAISAKVSVQTFTRANVSRHVTLLARLVFPCTV
jgi:hypothetical protein